MFTSSLLIRVRIECRVCATGTEHVEYLTGEEKREEVVVKYTCR